MSRHVAVLMGGWSAEREISLVTGAACAEGLREAGYEVSELDVGHDVAARLGELAPDVAFNALHGRWGEDGCVQGLLEVMEIPYSHSGVLASALAMDKPAAKELFAAAGLRCPGGQVLTRADICGGARIEAPYVIKPVNEGSSVGVQIVTSRENDDPLSAESWRFGNKVLVEPYIPGKELTVAVMDERALGALEIRNNVGRFYTYDAKYADGGSTHIQPELPAGVVDDVMDQALRAHRALGCRGVSRADFRYSEQDGPEGGAYLLEINTQPGMTPTSLVPEIAGHVGIGFAELVAWMVEDASCGR